MSDDVLDTHVSRKFEVTSEMRAEARRAYTQYERASREARLAWQEANEHWDRYMALSARNKGGPRPLSPALTPQA